MPLLIPYIAVLSVSLWLGYQLRFDFSVPPAVQSTYPAIFAWVVPLKLLCLWRFRHFQASPRHFSLPDFQRLASAVLVASAIAFAISSKLGSGFAPPRSVVMADFSLTLIGLTAIRVLFHEKPATATTAGVRHPRARRAGIIGAGLVGTALVEELAERDELGLKAVAFFDDNPSKWGTRIHNIPVVGAPEVLLDESLNLELNEVIIAMPSADAKRTAEIVKILQQTQIAFRTVPSLYELTSGRATVSQLRSLEIEDLLGRDPVQLAAREIKHLLEDNTIMVTGAGGSIGSELCRQIGSYGPAKLLLVEQSEAQLFQLEQQLIDMGMGGFIQPIVADIRDERRMTRIFQRYSPTIIFHAAAHKHVPMMEEQPGEAIKNNALATFQLAELAARYLVDRFIFISTDKAINPTNVMGATKRLGEICMLSLHASRPKRTKFIAVRFGNVLGSSGSVIPTFRKQIAAGGPVKVTHPDVTRYFMTISEAAGLVLQSAAQGSGGEIFTLDMGRPKRIVDLARQLIELSGLVPDRDIHIEFVGLRPGEKLFEELSYAGENITPTAHPKIMRFICEPMPLMATRQLLTELTQHLESLDPNRLKLALHQAVPEYCPQLRQQSRRICQEAPTSQNNFGHLVDDTAAARRHPCDQRIGEPLLKSP